MENTIEINEINEVDLGDDTLTADPTSGFGVATSTECTPDEPVVVKSESEFESGSRDGDRDGAGSRSVSGAGARGGEEGGSAAFQKKERQKTSKVLFINNSSWCKKKPMSLV
jgi:hypothetical protein